MKYYCIKQHDIKDCGAACLATISKQYGLNLSISKIREVAGTDKQGTNAYGIMAIFHMTPLVTFYCIAKRCFMKICFKGFVKSFAILPENDLPDDAVPFKEPKTIGAATIVSGLFSMVALGIVYAMSLLLGFLRDFNAITYFFDLRGLGLLLLLIIPHEILHALCYPKKSTVNIYIIAKYLSGCAWSSTPISKKRFIIMSLFPYFVLSIAPLIFLMVVPHNELILQTLIGLASYSALSCGGDFLNAFNALTQMPNNSMEILSKVNSYWYLK